MPTDAMPWIDNIDLRQAFEQALTDIPHTATFWVAYSGGLDSTALLFLAQQCLPLIRVKAIHVNHGVSPHADQWQAHCEARCAEWGIEIHTEKLRWDAPTSNFEAEARAQRYSVFESVLAPDDVLLMGHHLDDQIETFFLRLMRGAGVDGLSGMPETRPLGAGILVRPLLNRLRAELADLVEAEGLGFIEDESNDDNQYDRNFMRNRVLPLLASRWPMYRKPMARTLHMLGGLQQDTQEAQSADLVHRLTEDGGLKIPGLLDLPKAALLSLLREWLRQVAKGTPSMSQLQHILDDVVAAQADAQPVFQFGIGHIRRFKTAIYYTPALPALSENPGSLDSVGVYDVPGSGSVQITVDRVVDPKRPRLKQSLMPLEIRFETDNTNIRPVGRSGSRDLKRLMQEYRVKPWLRARMPLFYYQDQLVAVGNLFIVAGFEAIEGDMGHQIDWKPIA